MEYALVVEWAGTNEFSTLFFRSLSFAIDERDRQREKGNTAHIYQKVREDS